MQLQHMPRNKVKSIEFTIIYVRIITQQTNTTHTETSTNICSTDSCTTYKYKDYTLITRNVYRHESSDKQKLTMSTCISFNEIVGNYLNVIKHAGKLPQFKLLCNSY